MLFKVKSYIGRCEMNNLEMIEAKPNSSEVLMLPLQLVMSSLILFFAAGYAWPVDDETALKNFCNAFIRH